MLPGYKFKKSYPTANCWLSIKIESELSAFPPPHPSILKSPLQWFCYLLVLNVTLLEAYERPESFQVASLENADTRSLIHLDGITKDAIDKYNTS